MRRPSSSLNSAASSQETKGRHEINHPSDARDVGSCTNSADDPQYSAAVWTGEDDLEAFDLDEVTTV
jgi:hypothetical protein